MFNILFIFVQNAICAILAVPQQLNFSCLLRFTIISCGHDVFSLPTNKSKGKVKVVPYTFVRRGMPVREDTYPEPSACEVGWPVPFLAAFISPVLPPGTHLLLGEQ